MTYGFCLPPDARHELIDNPPDDLDAFVDAIIVAEGFDPALCDPRFRLWISESVGDWVFDNGSGRGTKSGLPLVAT